MAELNMPEALTRKIGPFPGWAWGAIVTVSAYAIMRYRSGSKKAPAGDSGGMVRDPVTGEFRSEQSNETVDPVTGERRTSSYSASGALNAFGGVGLPMAYQMPYSSGDVYVNLPGDTANMQPASRYPPKTGLGQKPNQVGGYWWTPSSIQDVAFLPAKAGLAGGGDLNAFEHMNPEMRNAIWLSMHWARIMDANPQINWTDSVERLIGVPMYIPPGSIDTNTVSWWKERSGLPPGAQWNAPQNYNPPTQQTSVNGTA